MGRDWKGWLLILLGSGTGEPAGSRYVYILIMGDKDGNGWRKNRGDKRGLSKRISRTIILKIVQKMVVHRTEKITMSVEMRDCSWRSAMQLVRPDGVGDVQRRARRNLQACTSSDPPCGNKTIGNLTILMFS